jgi:putative FmdB family regulatory protein
MAIVSLYFAALPFKRNSMPFYEYQCKSCGHELEAMQKVSDAPLKKCPHCGKSQLTRLMSAPVFRLKGGGWYETDFKDKDNQRNVADRPEDSAKDKAGEAKAADDTGKDAKAADAKAADAKGDAAADKPAGKTSGSDGAKAAAPAKRAARTGSPKKKPAKVKRRR